MLIVQKKNTLKHNPKSYLTGKFIKQRYRPSDFSFFFFFSYYSSSLDLESTVATPNEFFSFIKSKDSIKNNSFSLIDSKVSHNQNKKHKTKSISYYNSKVDSEQENKIKKLSQSDPVWRWGGGRGAAAG